MGEGEGAILLWLKEIEFPFMDRFVKALLLIGGFGVV